MESDPPTAFNARLFSLFLFLIIAGSAVAQQDQASTVANAVTEPVPLSIWISLGGGIFLTILGSLFFLVQTALGSMSRLTSNGEEQEFFWEKNTAEVDGSRVFERMCWAGGLFSHLLGLFLVTAWGAQNLPFTVPLNSLVTSLLVIVIHFVFFDMLVRQLGMAYTHHVLQVLALPIYILAYPFRLFILLYLALPGKKQKPQSNLYLREREFRLLPFLENIEQVVEEEAVELIDSVREFMQSTARDVMTPRTEIVGIERSTSNDDVYDFLKKTQHSRVVVFSGNTDHILGFLLAKEVLLRKTKDPFSLLRIPVRASVNDRLPEVLLELKRKHSYLAVVQDEYGGTAGIITLQDIFKIVMGDQLLEGDEGEGELWIEKKPNGEVLISGRVEVWELNQELETEFDETIARTVGGLVMHEVGQLPEIDEVASFEEGDFRVLEVENNRIKSLEFTFKAPEQLAQIIDENAGLEFE
ncbi:MAG: transporter associated domain-containing protein [Sumerlaeia bacterium]